MKDSHMSSDDDARSLAKLLSRTGLLSALAAAILIAVSVLILVGGPLVATTPVASARIQVREGGTDTFVSAVADFSSHNGFIETRGDPVPGSINIRLDREGAVFLRVVSEAQSDRYQAFVYSHGRNISWERDWKEFLDTISERLGDRVLILPQKIH
jgi:hypothetical protein